MSERAPASEQVLVVEDEADARAQMMRWLEGAGHHVVSAEAGGAALAVLDERRVSVAVCSIQVPGLEGFWLVEQLRRRAPETALVLATGFQDVGSAVTSLRLGVIDYLIKPFGRERLREAVRRGAEWHRVALGGRADRARLQADVDRQRTQLAEALGSVTIDSRAALETALGMLTFRDPALLDHGRRVAALARAIAALRRFDAAAIDGLERAALVHDLPKLVIPDAVAGKRGRLLPQERDLVRIGPTFGCQLMTGIGYLEDAAAIVGARYEWWDGSGYPQGLAGDHIPPASRVLAVADTFDTLVQPRRYRAAMDEAGALAEIRRWRGTQFEPVIVDTLARIVEADGASPGLDVWRSAGSGRARRA